MKSFEECMEQVWRQNEEEHSQVVQRILRRKRRREERYRRREAIEIAAVLALVFVAVAALTARAQPAEPQATPTVAEASSDAPRKIVLAEATEMVEDGTELTAEEEEAILLEDERIEAALVEQGYYRADIPLTYLEQDVLHTAADEFGVDYFVMVALIERETNFRNIPGDGGNAYGYCQIWPKWWSELMAEIGADDLNEPFDNFRTAAAILAHYTERHGSIRDALTAYNSGNPGVSKYATAILTYAEKWRSQ